MFFLIKSLFSLVCLFSVIVVMSKNSCAALSVHSSVKSLVQSEISEQMLARFLWNLMHIFMGTKGQFLMFYRFSEFLSVCATVSSIRLRKAAKRFRKVQQWNAFRRIQIVLRLTVKLCTVFPLRFLLSAQAEHSSNSPKCVSIPDFIYHLDSFTAVSAENILWWDRFSKNILITYSLLFKQSTDNYVVICFLP